MSNSSGQILLIKYAVHNKSLHLIVRRWKKAGSRQKEPAPDFCKKERRQTDNTEQQNWPHNKRKICHHTVAHTRWVKSNN